MFNLLKPEFNQKLTRFGITAYSFGIKPKKT
jgi:hypothetical protein